MKNASPVLRPSSARDPCMELPEPASLIQATSDGDTVIHVRRHGNPAGPRVVLSHGNGLAIDAYYPFWSLLLDDFDVLVFDLRSHGWNDRGSLCDHTIVSLCAMRAVLKSYDLARVFSRKQTRPIRPVKSATRACLCSTSSPALCYTDGQPYSTSSSFFLEISANPPPGRQATFQASMKAILQSASESGRAGFDSSSTLSNLILVPMFGILEAAMSRTDADDRCVWVT